MFIFSEVKIKEEDKDIESIKMRIVGYYIK